MIELGPVSEEVLPFLSVEEQLHMFSVLQYAAVVPYFSMASVTLCTQHLQC